MLGIILVSISNENVITNVCETEEFIHTARDDKLDENPPACFAWVCIST